MNQAIRIRLLVFTLSFTPLSAHATFAEGKKAQNASGVEQLAQEIGQSSFSSVSQGLKEQMDGREFDRLFATFQDLRNKSDHEVTAEEVFRALEKTEGRQAFDLMSIFRRTLRACFGPLLDEHRERAKMNAEEFKWRMDRAGGRGCHSSLENILDKGAPTQQQTADVRQSITPSAPASTAN